MLRKVYFGQAHIESLLICTLERVFAFLSIEQRIVLANSGKAFLFFGYTPLFLFGIVIAKLYLLQSKHIQLCLLKKVRLLIGMPHDSSFVVLKRFSWDSGVADVGADFTNVGKSDEFTQLNLTKLTRSRCFSFQILIFNFHRLVLNHKFIIKLNASFCLTSEYFGITLTPINFRCLNFYLVYLFLAVSNKPKS